MTNNQFAKGKDKTDCLYQFGYWNLVIGHYLLTRR